MRCWDSYARTAGYFPDCSKGGWEEEHVCYGNIKSTLGNCPVLRRRRQGLKGCLEEEGACVDREQLLEEQEVELGMRPDFAPSERDSQKRAILNTKQGGTVVSRPIEDLWKSLNGRGSLKPVGWRQTS